MLLYYSIQQCVTSGHLCKLPCTSIHYRFHLAIYASMMSLYTGIFSYAVQHSCPNLLLMVAIHRLSTSEMIFTLIYSIASKLHFCN